MSTATKPNAAAACPPLENGDRLSRDEFERRYAAMTGVKAELIEGVVHMPSPVRYKHHGEPHANLNGWLFNYKLATPGVGSGDNVSVRLDLDNEPQPDLLLMIESGDAGQARISADDFIEGAPELVAEIVSSSVSYDLGAKLHAYRRNGVREYLVWRVLDAALDWFVLHEGRYEPMAPDADGLLKSRAFPGLWLDVASLLAGDLPHLIAALNRGLASPEHAGFVQRLRAD